MVWAALSVRVQAQELSQAPVPRPTSTQLEQVVVTGSRIPLTTGEGPQDLKVYTREQIDQSGGTTVVEFLNTLPDVSLSITENGFQTLSGTTTIGLHGLPIGTTLVLLNGRRVSTSGAAQQHGLTYFDLNTIPLAAVDRIEIVSQGSSAVYGSDAIAGVVNIILKSRFDGVEANAKYGFATGTHQDDVDLTWGRTWDKGSLVVVGNYLTRTELPAYSRALTSDNNYVAFGGSNADFYMCPNQANIYALGGANLPGLSAPYAAVPAGYTGAPSRQEFLATAGSLNRCSLFKYVSLVPSTERAGLLVRGTYNPDSSIELYGNLLVSHIEQFGHNAPPILFGSPGFQSYTVGAANPFNPFGEKVGVSEMLSDLGRQVQDLRTSYLNATVGLRGSFAPSWSWDLGISDSEDHTLYTQSNVDAAKVQAALNSSDPNTALNPFVAGPLGSAALLQSLVVGDHIDSLGRAMVIDLTLRGQVPALPAGPVRVAIGGEYERDTLFQDQFFFPGPAQRTNFHRKTYAFFVENRVPVVGAIGGAGVGDLLDLTLAGRMDHDDQFGSQWTPQLGLELRPLPRILIRASYSRAFRAPNLIDLYAAQSVSNHAVVMDPSHGNTFETVVATLGGNPQLRPEKGLARSVGLVYSDPAAPEGLQLSVTHWQIDETNAIQQFPLQVIVDNAALFPGAVTRASTCQGSPPCPITAVSATYQNFGRLHVAGLDYQAAYQRTTRIGVFVPSVSVSQTYRYDATLAPGSPAINAVSVGQDTGDWAPRWKGTAALDWHQGNWAVYLDGRYVGRYQDYDSSRVIGNFWLVDANVAYRIGHLYARIGGVNIFNKLPQFSNFEEDLVGYDPTQADIRGRFLYAQLGIRW